MTKHICDRCGDEAKVLHDIAVYAERAGGGHTQIKDLSVELCQPCATYIKREIRTAPPRAAR